MRTSILICLLFTIADALPFQDCGPIADVGYAKYEGKANATLGTNTWYGIKYAEPPVGDLRWRAPVPVSTLQAASPQPINATTPTAICVQGIPAWFPELIAVADVITPVAPAVIVPASEDCLTLDVIVPQNPVSKSLPVIVQIHGGGYTTGSTKTIIDGTQFVKHSNGTVLYVQLQYRLGAYGFLGGKDVAGDVDSNIGLLDQRLALEWVQKHIHNFGGDPSKVTIWGPSAGGGSVQDHMIAYGGVECPPFRAAIPEYPWNQPYHSKDTLSKQYAELLLAANCTDITCLRGLDFETLSNATALTYITAYKKGLYGYGDFYYGPYVDGDFIQNLPSVELAQGRFSKVPVLLDHEAFEGFYFVNQSVSTPELFIEQFEQVFQTTAPSEFFTQLEQLYPTTDFGDAYFDQAFFQSEFFATLRADGLVSAGRNPNFWRTQAAFGDFAISCPSFNLVSAVTRAGLPAWKLLFNTGAFVHGSTGTYLLLDSSELGADAPTANIMKDYFLAFAINLDPNVRTGTDSVRPPFPEYGSQGEVVEIGTTNITIMPDSDNSARCAFWQAQGSVALTR